MELQLKFPPDYCSKVLAGFAGLDLVLYDDSAAGQGNRATENGVGEGAQAALKERIVSPWRITRS
jgi:hypothetical protein